MNIDWEEVARQQPLDPEFRQLRANTRSGLNLKSIDIGRTQLIVDTSNGPYRPYVPFASRRRIFNAIHGLGHPGVERTRQAMCAKFVWPSIREDSSRWARECLACQQSKVTRHTTPPIGTFEVPNKRFEHINMDIVTLPLSNGYKYILTAVDRFTRWPVAIPMVDISADSVVDAFAHGWIASFGLPATVTTDRGSQFSSELFKQLTKVWGIKLIMTTPYHPEANGLVERLHRRLKESLMALGVESPEDWYWRLPMSLLAIRTTLKPDVGASPADLVYGEGLSVPGEILPSNPADDPQLARQRASALSDLRLAVSRLQPVPTSAHRMPLLHVPQELETCTHVFVRRGGFQPSLSTPYSGPFRVLSRNAANFRIAMPGRAHEVVSISRVKPVFAEEDDAEAARPASPPPPGRPPRPPQNPPAPRRRNRRRRRPREDDDDVVPPFSPPPFQPDDDEFPPIRPTGRRGRSQRVESDDERVDARRAPSPVPVIPNPPEDQIVDTTDADLPPPSWFDMSDDVDMSDDDVPPEADLPVDPPRADWFSPETQPQPRVPPTACPPPQRRLFSSPSRGDFSFRPRPRPPPPFPAPTAQREPAVPSIPRTRFSSSVGRFSRRRPDVSALNSIVREHLGLPTPSPPLDDSGASGHDFFPSLRPF